MAEKGKEVGREQLLRALGYDDGEKCTQRPGSKKRECAREDSPRWAKKAAKARKALGQSHSLAEASRPRKVRPASAWRLGRAPSRKG